MNKQKEWKYLYNTALWKRLRLSQLTKEPCCAYCEKQGRIEIATVVDHIKPHKGDKIKFYNPDNLQSMCKQHHDSTKQKEENSGAVIGCDLDGMPIDPHHHWN